MDKTDLSDFKGLFIDTAKKHLETIKLSLTLLQKNSLDTESLNKIFIASHSLKGESLAMGYMANAAMGELLEKIFHSAKDGKLVVTPELLVATTQAVIKLSQSIDTVEKEDKESTFSDEQIALEKASGISLGEKL